MAIPVISEVIGFIQGFFQILPKSLKYLLFLVFIIAALAVLPFIFHMMGVHCDSNKVVQKTSFFDFGGNFDLALMSDEDYYNSSNYIPATQFTIISGDLRLSCAPLIRFDHSSIFGDFYVTCDNNDTLYNNTDCFYALRIHRWKELFFPSTPKCFVCDNIVDVTFYSLSPFDEDAVNGKYCFSDAYPNNASGCGDVENCEMPLGYKFNQATGKFICYDNSICGTNATEITYSIDVKLKSMGAEALYSESDDEGYSNALRFQCDNNLNPQLALYRIPLFDYKIWLGLMVLGALFFFLNKIKRH